MRIMISRTDAIGDVILTLPLAGFLKKVNADNYIIFIGRTYTRAVIAACADVDEFIDLDELLNMSREAALSIVKQKAADTILHVFPNKILAGLAQKAGIKNRVGTSHRVFHWFTCNKLVNLGRKNSDLHETELNFKLLEVIIDKKPEKPLGQYLRMKSDKLSSQFRKDYLVEGKYNLVIHPKSKGSAREWPAKHYLKLVDLLQNEKVNIILTGTLAEGKAFLSSIGNLPSHVKTSFGRLNLSDLVSLIGEADGLLACSTGPLHIAAAFGKDAMGIYPPIRPMHPGRWAPIGEKTKVFCLNKTCNLCRNQTSCACINDIQPIEIYTYIKNISNQHE
ncbi:MAG: glycosyltransferase family 9 protein [Flavobacteriales bacterium]